MKNILQLSVIAALVIGLLGGYVAYPFVNRSGKPSTAPRSSTTLTPTINKETFSNEQYGISFDYPAYWKINPSSQVFKEGDLFAIQTVGETQQENTEFYDGGRFVVMTPVPTDLDLNAWVNSQYTAGDQISDITIKGIRLKKIYICGLGCSTYYHTVINGRVYGFNTFAEGSQKSQWQAEITQILNTVVLPNALESP